MASRGNTAEAFPFASEQLHAELFFKQFQLLADSGLAGIHALGRRGDIQTIVDNRQEVFELLQFHLINCCDF
jgi:hypothetical protein